MEGQATATLPRLPTAAAPEKRANGRLEKAHQATFDAKEMAKLVAHYVGMRADDQRKHAKDIGQLTDVWSLDSSGMWAITHLVELTARADSAVEEAIRQGGH